TRGVGYNFSFLISSTWNHQSYAVLKKGEVWRFNRESCRVSHAESSTSLELKFPQR
ncbi:hypothetical protein TNCT_289171, partial [Trichonephila clavata]